ncbi:hypothetical protein OnM2_031063 [Erysiphe neolycopersici]|uniref:SET domain-containing protein n=1 Tax=Erysiphe neolycopersici TaxID=212602 RepID=A0A420HZ17_9PEZI|nr:hypothetical protein OnM2_031063 [Erysiphe neolycopersici]
MRDSLLLPTKITFNMTISISSMEPVATVKSTAPALKPSYADVVRVSLNQISRLDESPIKAVQSLPGFVLFGTEFFEVRKTLQKGFGAFAIRDIDEGTIILAEKSLMKAENMTIYHEFEKLNYQQRKVFCSLARWEMLGPWPIAIFKTNRFEITRAIGGIFPKSSRFNHSCHPYATCTYIYEEADDVLIITAIKDIAEGDEITISYTNAPSTLPGNYGFKCDCPNCCNSNFL